MSDQEKSIAEIERDMARSRAEIERTTEALKAKIEPEHLADAARQVIQESTERVEAKVKELADQASVRVEDLGQQASGYFQQNPLPFLLAGMGIGLLVSMAERDSASLQYVNPRGEEPSRLNQALARNPKLLRAQRRTVRRVRRLNHQHPVLLGAAALGAGLLLGVLLPSTRREDQLLGPTRDRLLETGKESAQQAITQAKDAVESELQKRKAEAGEVAQTAEEAALSAFRQARNETLEDRSLANASAEQPIVP